MCHFQILFQHRYVLGFSLITISFYFLHFSHFLIELIRLYSTYTLVHLRKFRLFDKLLISNLYSQTLLLFVWEFKDFSFPLKTKDDLNPDFKT